MDVDSGGCSTTTIQEPVDFTKGVFHESMETLGWNLKQ
jgi:hypothetical protein